MAHLRIICLSMHEGPKWTGSNTLFHTIIILFKGDFVNHKRWRGTRGSRRDLGNGTAHWRQAHAACIVEASNGFPALWEPELAPIVRSESGKPMILSNIEIQRAMDEQRLVIEPAPQPRRPREDQYCPYDTHAVDLRLHDEIAVPQSGPYHYDAMEPGTLSELIARHSERVKLTISSPFSLQPHQFILARTLERIELPVDKGTPHLAARIEGKSSWARCGLMVHFTSPTVHPGWAGSLTLEMINLGPMAFVLRPGMHIAQLIVEEVRGEIFPNPSEFHDQSTPEGST